MSELRKKAMTRLAICAVALVASIIFSVLLLTGTFDGKTDSGEHIRNMLAITLGTGVGSGIIINSKIYNGYGFAGGEFGHTTINVNGRPCTCGRRAKQSTIRANLESPMILPSRGIYAI